jgi:subtilisin-like proprotein convertase family protein
MKLMNPLSKKITFLLFIAFTISCSKDDAQVTVPITLSPAVSFENNTDIIIPDSSAGIAAESSINFPTVGLITDKNKIFLEMNISHPYCGDLVFILIAPDGTKSEFIQRASGGGRNAFESTNKLRFNSLFTKKIGDAGTIESRIVLAGNYKESSDVSIGLPELEPIFSNLVGKSVYGTWKLNVKDFSNGDVGKIESWKLIFEEGALKQL